MKPISKKTIADIVRWKRKWDRAGDHARSVYRGAAARRMIDLWELVRRTRGWRSLSSITTATAGSERRWYRRNLYTLAQAGLVEVEQRDRRVTYFRRKPR